MSSPVDDLPSQATSEPDLSVVGPMVTVRLVDLPLQVMARAQQAGDEMMREFTLIASSLHRGDGTTAARPLPARLVRIVESLDQGYGPFTGEQDAALSEAIASGATVLPELVYEVPASVSTAVQVLGDMLDEADAYCLAGQHLLTLATPQELVDFRRWFLDEFARQAAGEPPLPWPEHVRGSSTA